MKASGAIVDVICIVGLALPGLTVYRRWPDFIFAYVGAALLAFILLGWRLARGTKDAS